VPFLLSSSLSGSLIHSAGGIEEGPTPVSTTKTHKYHIQVKTVTQVVRFQKSTGANGTTQDITLNFTPKAIIVFSANGTSDGSAEAYFQESIGFSDGTNHAGYVNASRDAVGPSTTGRIHYTGSIWAKLSDTVPTGVIAAATCAFSTNKVTFTWYLNDAVATDITLWAFGGDDITDAKVNTVSIGRTTAGTQNYTGLGFDPTGDGKSALFMLATNTQTLDATTTTALGAFGCSTGIRSAGVDSGKQWYRCTVSEQNASPTDTWKVSGGDRSFAVLDTSGAFSHYCYHSAWVTDGFQLTWDGPPSATDFKFSYLVINGGNWDSGTLTTPSSATNDVDTTVAVDSKPIRGLMLTGVANSTTAVITTQNTYSLGATDGTNSSVIASIDEDAQNPSDSYKYSDTASLYYLMGVNGALTHSATFDSFTTNNFRLDYPTLGAAHLIHWTVVADQTTLTQITQTKTHKYNIISQVTRTRTHKYNVIAKVTQTKTHKYNIITKVTRTRTHLYNIIGKVVQTRTHKYNIIQKITRTRTHKYNILQQITRTRTHKYNIIAKVVQTKTHKFNVIGKITRTRTHVFNVLQQVIKTRTHKYNVLQQIVQTRTHKYNIIGKITATKTHVFSVIARVTTTKTHKYNILQQITRTRTHKFDISSSIIEVTTTKTHKFNVTSAFEQVTTTKTHKYNVIAKITKTKTHVFSVLQQVLTSKTHKYNVLQRVLTTKTHVFSVIARVLTSKTHIYNIIQQIVRTRTHKYNVIGKIVVIKTHKFNIITKITQTRTHKFNITIAVSPARTRTHKFSILALVTRTRTHKYNIIGRIVRTRTHKYNMGGKVLLTKRHRYDVGFGGLLQELGGSTNAFVRFQDRVQIIDIIADIQNKVFANVEIPVSKPPANIAIGVVAIAEYASSIFLSKTASTEQILKHRIASQQILPPIIEVIENRVKCDHIAIEILPLDRLRLLVHSHISIGKLANTILYGQTQIKPSDKTKIKIASATMLQQTQETIVGSEALLEIQAFPRPVITEEIMSRQKAKILKTLINLLSSDHLFE
jgi:hypothetical protein